MRTSSLGRRLGHVASRTRSGCPACRAAPPLVVLWPEDPEPARSCAGCSRGLTATTRVRFVQLDRGPA